MIDNAFPPLRLPDGVDHISVLVPRLNTKFQSCPGAVASDSVNDFKVFPRSDDAGVVDHATPMHIGMIILMLTHHFLGELSG
jgi:hypothetical protein